MNHLFLDITQFFGRLHPLILHLPIGILIMAFLLSFINRKQQKSALNEAIGIAINVGMVSAVLAAISGYILAREGGYEEAMLWRHQVFGIITAAGSIIAFVLFRMNKQKSILPFLTFLMVILMITGHLGGSLTHGSNFLTEPFQPQEEDEPVIQSLNQAIVFNDLIQPIIRDKCNRCHNESKLKGDLLLSSIQGIQNGGKNGALFISGNASASLMMERIHLPVDEKKHMPPKGKKQLTPDEIVLMSWWINEGGDFDAKVGDYNKSEKVEAILNKYVQSGKDIYTLDIQPANQKSIDKLKSLGIEVEHVAKGMPFLNASLKGRTDIDKRTIKQLKEIAPQLVSLDLSSTNMNDQMLSSLAEFKHLQKLFLQKTEVTGARFEALDKLEYLEYLNLVETQVEDASVAKLANLKSLKDIYLWQTNMSPNAIEQLINQRPRLNVNIGADKEIFGSAQLKPPAIIAEQDIFMDSLQVSFDINFNNVNLFYTLDGTTPDTTSLRYEGPFTLRETSEIKVISQKQGWETSEPASRILLRSKYKPANVQLNRPPHPNYPGEGAKSLTDFKKGTIVFKDGNWLGYEKQGFTATFDMGDIVDISRVNLSALESSDQWIFLPKGMDISVSQDGQKYQPVKEAKYPIVSGPEPPSLKNFSEQFEPVKARYVRVDVHSHLVNPQWHPAAGEPCWVFVDEVLIE
jgi:uncharacterized membrane protein